MKIYLSNQQIHFAKHLETLKALPVMNYSREKLKEKKNVIEMYSLRKLKELDLRFLFDYQIFPGNIMSFLTEWNVEGRDMRVGDTIMQQVYLPPVSTFSQKIIFGVRICEIFDETYRKGFSYETIEGHVEKGISTFIVEEDEGGLWFLIHTFSKPGNLLTRILGPVFSVPYQTYCTNAALKNVQKQLK